MQAAAFPQRNRLRRNFSGPLVFARITRSGPLARLTNGVVTRILRREYCHFVVQTFVIRARYFRYEEFFLRMNRTRERELSKNEKTYAVHTLIPLSVLRSNVPCKTGGFMEPPHPFEGAKSAMSQFVGSVSFSTLTFS
jgi:hypothetical protein